MCVNPSGKKTTFPRLRVRKWTPLTRALRKHHYSERCCSDAGAQTAPPLHLESVDERRRDKATTPSALAVSRRAKAQTSPKR